MTNLYLVSMFLFIGLSTKNVDATIVFVHSSNLELIPGGGFQPSDGSITEYYRYLNAHKDYNPWFK